MEKKIKILFFMDGIGNAGGIQEMAIKWMENINRKKFQIDILSYNTGKHDNYAERVQALGGKVFLIDTYMRKGKLFASLKQTEDFFKTHKYDILHAHSSSKAVFIMYYAKKYGIKTRILHSHCTQFVIQEKVLQLFANILKIPTLALTTDYYACSPEAGEFLFGKKAVEDGKVTIAHNGIETSCFVRDDAIRNRIRTELGLSDKFVIGNVGRFRPQKNHTYLMDIFKAITLKDENAVLVCVGNGELEESIKEKAKQLKIDSKIRFLGFRNDVNDVMQCFDVLVMPSLFEGLPVTGVEAQAVGIPALFATTITKDAAILPESGYLSLNDSPEMWADRILSYKSVNRSNTAHEYIISHGYDIKIETNKLADFYRLKANK
jgi:glycosyltransferase involved in cell wall biosynthesis